MIKIYEALGAIGDDRIKVDGNTARVYSSSRSKFYEVVFDPITNAITANDNGSYWRGYLGYPIITFLLKSGRINFKPQFSRALKNIAWKDVNTKFKNDFAKTELSAREIMSSRDVDLAEFDQELARIANEIKKLDLRKLPSNLKPPTTY